MSFFLIIKPTRCTNFSKFYFGMKLYMFRTVPLSIIRSFSLYTQQWYMLYRFADNLRGGSGWKCSSIPILPSFILILLASCQQTCITHTIAVCTVRNSSWWKRNCPKHVEFYSKIKFWEISTSSWFYYKKFIAMHGHMNVICWWASYYYYYYYYYYY